MEVNTIVQLVRDYNSSLSHLTPLQSEFVRIANTSNYLYGFQIKQMPIPSTVDKLLKQEHHFQSLLPNHYKELCDYLQHIQNYTCNTLLIRMDVRSQDLSHYFDRIKHAIGAFYIFYGANLSFQKLIYGEYRQILQYHNMAPVIAREILYHNEEVIQYCKDVLTSENNTGIITRDLIIAIEQSDNQELQEILTNLFLAAKLQEGLRQSIIETVDEGSIHYFYRIIDVIKEENLLRFSSVQRGLYTWIGIGYEKVEKRISEMVFDCLYEMIHDENKRKEALYDENPLKVYLALYVLGIQSLEKAIDEALGLLDSQKPHIIASALIYLKLTNHFSIIKYMNIIEKYKDNEWIVSLYVSECLRYEVKKLRIDKKQCYELFDLLYPFMTTLKGQQNYSTKHFEWFSITIYKESVVKFLSELLIQAPNQSRIELLLPYISILWPQPLKAFLEKCFSYASLEFKKEFMVKEIISHNKELSQFICEEYKKLDLTHDDILKLEKRLTTKKSYARAHIIQVLASQDQKQVLDSFSRLQNSTEKTVQESAIELQRHVPQYFETVEESKVEILGRKEGFGLYKPYQMHSVPYYTHLSYKTKGIFKKNKYVDLDFLHVYTKQQILDYLSLWNQRIIEHEKDEYLRLGTYHQIGEKNLWLLDYKIKSLDALPLGEVWRQYFQYDHISIDVMFQIMFLLNSFDIYYENIFTKDIHIETISSKEVEQFQYFSHIKQILTYYFYELDTDYIFVDKAIKVLEIFLKYSKIIGYTNNDYMGNKVTYALSSLDVFTFVYHTLHLEDLSDEQFQDVFPIVYGCYLRFHLKCDTHVQNKMTIMPLIVSRACVLGIIPQSVLFEIILDKHNGESPLNNGYYYYRQNNMLFEAMNTTYFENKGIYRQPHFDLPQKNRKAHIYLRETLDQICETLISMETTRINEVSEVTSYVQNLYVIRGIKFLLIALKMLDKENIKRQTYGDDRQTVFANVMRHCYPLESDTPQMLKDACIDEKRLVEVAMMAPQWIDFVNEVLRWDGFKDACYYFIAHMKESSQYEYKKAEIAHYTELDPLDLKDGAFDMKWCQEIYDKMGTKRMKILYDASRLLCENSFHTRARKYFDACVGNKDKEEFLKSAKEKRNKDSLNAYCIAPIVDEKDLLERYLYVQQFLKESKKFGAQRQASEKRSCEIALMNLARNSQYETVDRLSWRMESQMINEYHDVFQRQAIDDIEVVIEIDELGRSEICAFKNNKRLKNIPARLNKNEQVIRIKEAHRLFKQQYSRTLAMLQKSMEERTQYDLNEIETMATHPIAKALIQYLVLTDGQHFGFYFNRTLTFKEECYKIQGSLRIAHVYDLYENYLLKDFQQYIFEHEIVQPFKQVFRELYLKLDDELEQDHTLRYTGYQIQTVQASATLKNRNWNTSYEYGLERVYYKDDLIVNLYADANWFSPSDIEAPSIDYVSFYNRRYHQPVLIKDVDNIIFSEAMRDVDLAVSLAFVGGVDPVTSMSTIDLRRTIIEYTCQLMKLNNVDVQGHFANIKGKYNDYSVHLGSGMIHQLAGGSIYMVPVWSGQRGKVYLPFLDEDPLTAQIITKIVMLAEDYKIKDPSILAQINQKDKEN